jgi:hypothetical protein
MKLTTDQNPLETPTAPPRGWLRATIVAGLAVVFVGAGIGFVGFLS